MDGVANTNANVNSNTTTTTTHRLPIEAEIASDIQMHGCVHLTEYVHIQDIQTHIRTSYKKTECPRTITKFVEDASTSEVLC